jgi:excisionase family DNA binding protein
MNRDRVYGRIERKQLTAHKVGRLWKFKRDGVDVWIWEGKASEQVVEPSAPHEGQC